MKQKAVSNASVSLLPIESVDVGVRRRSKLGGLQSLKRSIAIHGLIHPILVRSGNQLVAGARRLEACKRLGWRQIPARLVDGMNDDELRELEAAENRERQALNDFDTSKARLAEIRQAEADLISVESTKIKSNPKNPKGAGRKSKGRASRAAIADAIGISDKGQRDIEKHVALAEQYPFMQRRGWVQHNVLEAGTELENISTGDRPKLAALLDQDAIPPKTAIDIIKNVATMATDDRRDLFELARSGDEHDRRTALTKAAAVPPPVDPGLTLLGDAEQNLRRALSTCRATQFKPDIERLLNETTRLYASFKEWNAHVRRTDSIAKNGPSEKSA